MMAWVTRSAPGERSEEGQVESGHVDGAAPCALDRDAAEAREPLVEVTDQPDGGGVVEVHARAEAGADARSRPGAPERDAAVAGGPQVMQRRAVVVDALVARPPDVLEQVGSRRGQDDRAGSGEEGAAEPRERGSVGAQAHHGASRRDAAPGRVRLGSRAATKPKDRRPLEDADPPLEEDAAEP